MAKELYIGPEKDDVRFRLQGTVCRHNGRPCLVVETRRHSVYIQYLDLPIYNQVFTEIDYRVPEFDYRSAPLGYMNYGGAAYYLARIPSRENQRFGLTQAYIDSLPEMPRDLRNYVNSVEFGNCILGKYPTVQECMDLLELGETQSAAFHRHFALARLNAHTLAIHYRGRLVGLREGGRFRLLDSQDVSFIEPIMRKAGLA